MSNTGGLSVGEFCSPSGVNLPQKTQDVMREWVGVGAQILDGFIPKIMSHVTLCNKKIREMLQHKYGEGTETDFVKNVLDGYGKDMGDFVSAHLCHNCFTEVTHTECDCCFTLLFVPPQLQTNTKVHFHIHIDGIKDLYVSMSPGVSLMYSEYLLSHRQKLQETGSGGHFSTLQHILQKDCLRTLGPQ